MGDHDRSQESEPHWPMLARILDAERKLEELAAKHLEEKRAARDELRTAARALAQIENPPERLGAIEWAFSNTKARRPDLAWALLGRESSWHLHKVLAGPHRACQECGKETLVGNRFFDHAFYCDSCAQARNAESARAANEQAREWARRNTKRRDRIAKLKASAPLSDAEANELARLIALGKDGPNGQLIDWLIGADIKSTA